MSDYKVLGVNGVWSPAIKDTDLYNFVRNGQVKPHTEIFDERTGIEYAAGDHPTLKVIFRQHGIDPAHRPAPPPLPANPPPSPSHANSAPVTKPDNEPLRFAVLGRLLLVGGLTFAGWMFFFFDVTVPLSADGARFAGVERVNNIGLMQQQTTGMMLGMGAAIIGAIFLAMGRNRRVPLD